MGKIEIKQLKCYVSILIEFLLLNELQHVTIVWFYYNLELMISFN